MSRVDLGNLKATKPVWRVPAKAWELAITTWLTTFWDRYFVCPPSNTLVSALSKAIKVDSPWGVRRKILEAIPEAARSLPPGENKNELIAKAIANLLELSPGQSLDELPKELATRVTKSFRISA